MKEQEKLHDFVCDIKMLSEQYGWNLTQALDLIGWKPKTKDELLVEYAKEKYTQGTAFMPLDKKRPRVSSGRVDLICDRLFVYEDSEEKQKLFLVYDPELDKWAEINN